MHLREWFKWDSGNPVFDVLETIFYYDLPRMFGLNGTVAVKGEAVHTDYSLWKVRYLARPHYDKLPRSLISESTKYRDTLYMYTLGTYRMDPLEAIFTTYKFYAPQQILRVIFAKIAEDELGILRIPVWTIRPDRQMEMHSDVPAHRTITHVGYHGYERYHFSAKPEGVTRDFLDHLVGRGWDYALSAIRAAHIIAWAEYFAETEDAYVFGTLTRVSRELGISKANYDLLMYLKDRVPAPRAVNGEIRWTRIKREIKIL